VLVPT